MITAEDREAIREGFARLLNERCTEADVRRVLAPGPSYDLDLWSAMAEMGLAGLIADPEFGGVGAGPVEVEILMEEAGASLLVSPFFSSAILAASLLSAAGDPGARERLLPGIADGSVIATVAFTGDQGGWSTDTVKVEARDEGNSARLSGEASFVTYGADADVLLVFARTNDGLAAFEVDPAAHGLEISRQTTFDAGQRLARLIFADVEAVPIVGSSDGVFEKVMALAHVGLAGEQAGGARRVFDFTVDYVKTRVQFGRPVGGFQAIKHMAADLLVEVESATSAARHAAQALADGTPDAAVLINLAGFACADAFSQVAATSIQMHGGIGFTWEHPAHLYLRRARADAQLFGSSNEFRDRYVTASEAAA